MTRSFPDRELRPDAPRVSVIIIFLNGERFIEEAVESVLSQDFDSFELILVDDGSTDGSTAIARTYAEQHPHRVRYVDHPDHANRGMSASRNRGLGVARGEYVAFIDADDVWSPNKLTEQVAIMDAHPEVGMLCGAARMYAAG
jgi:glycosyltransferase involved in cell wall biosynthesis